MAVTLNTIPAQTGELVRALFTIAEGGDGAEWFNSGTNAGSVSVDSDLVIEPGGDESVISRVRWIGGRLRFNKVGGGTFTAMVATGGALDGKTFLVAYDDQAPLVDIDLPVSGRGNVGGGFYNTGSVPAPHDDALTALAANDLVNIVISDPQSVAPAVVHDIGASFVLGSPAFSAVLGKTLPEDQDISADFTIGAPAFSVRLDKTIAGAIGIAAGFTLGAPSFSGSLEKTTVPPHDDAASFFLGAPAFSAVLGKLGIQDHDSTVEFAMGAPAFSAALVLEDATTQDRAASFDLGAPSFSAVGQKTVIGVRDINADFPLGIPSFSVVVAKRTPSERTGSLQTSLSTGIAQIKRTLLAGGLLRSVQWMQRTGEKDERGRQAVTVKLLDALIEQRPGLDRSTIDTDRNDNTVLTILDPVAITDSDTFRWGDHTYKVSKVDGVIENAATGVRFTSEVTVIR